MIGESGKCLSRLKDWLPPTDDTDRVIYQLELLAVLWALVHFGNRLRGARLRLWIDNEAARFTLIGGYSSNPWAARIISEAWVQLVYLDIDVHFERVASKENISDGPSRDYFGLVDVLKLATYGGDEVDSWVLLEAVLA